MIVTVTVNPSIDRAIALASPLEPGAVQRATADRVDAGGKGVNVSRVLAAAARDTVAVFPAAIDDPFVGLVQAAGVAAIPVPGSGFVRTNITLSDPDGTTTKINLPGADLHPATLARLRAEIVAACEGARWLVLAGSLPPGADERLLVDVIHAVRDAWGAGAPRIAVDTSGDPLHAVVAEAHPDLIKPNGEELAELLGEDPGSDSDDPQAAARRAARLIPAAVGAALVTLGGRGALLVDAEGVLIAEAPRVEVLSTVGAGDSALAGYLLADAEGAGRADRLARAVSYGSAAASLPGTEAPTPADAARIAVRVHDGAPRP